MSECETSCILVTLNSATWANEIQPTDVEEKDIELVVSTNVAQSYDFAFAEESERSSEVVAESEHNVSVVSHVPLLLQIHSPAQI